MQVYDTIEQSQTVPAYSKPWVLAAVTRYTSIRTCITQNTDSSFYFVHLEHEFGQRLLICQHAVIIWASNKHMLNSIPNLLTSYMGS